MTRQVDLSFAEMDSLLAQVRRVEVERRLEFAALPAGWAAVGLLALAVLLCAAVVYLYRHEGRAGASPRARWIMAGLRCTVIGLIGLIWLEPVLATYLHRLIDSYTVVLVDTSASMDLQDRYRRAEDIERVRTVAPAAGQEPIRRTDVVARLLERDDRALLHGLAEHNRVRIFTFADEPTAVATVRATRESTGPVATEGPEGVATPAPTGGVDDAPVQFSAQGPATDVGTAVRLSVESLGRAPVAGVVLITDGGINRGDDAEAIAAYAQDRRIPLHIVGVGDPAPPRNVRVAEVVAPDNVFADDPFAVVAQIAAQGMAGDAVTVQLVERSASEGEGRVVASRVITLGADGAIEPLSFDHRQERVGRFGYRVAVPVGETESVTDDNSKQVTVHVMENKLRVLVVAGAASWEYRYLMRLLTRDPTFEVSCWLQSADEHAVRDGNVVINHLPATAEELFAYDALVLLDPDPIELTSEWAELAADLVTRHGGGLLYQAARLNASSFLRDLPAEPLRRILPVTFDPDADLILNQIGHYQQASFPLIVPPDAAGHPALKLPAGLDAGYDWTSVGEVFWHLPVLREKQVATVLMRHGDPRMQNAYGPHVLLATQYAGAGRTAFLGFDGTWRWRAHGPAIFDKFWVQTIRYLVEGKLAGGNQRGMILTDKETYPLGAVVQVSARVFDRAYKPLQLPDVTVKYTIEGDERTLLLVRNDDRPGWYDGSFVPPRTGSCQLALPIPGDDLTTLSGDVARREIQIERPNLEIIKPQMDRDGLRALAEATPGGRYYDVSQTAGLAEAIPDRHESTTIRSRPTPLWDDAWVLALLVGLLGAEWTMRKVFRLL